MHPATVELLRDILREAKFLISEAERTDRDSFLRDEVLKRSFNSLDDVVPLLASRVHEAAPLRFRHRVTELGGCVDPELHGVLRVRQRRFLRITMSHTTGKLRHLGDEDSVLFAPIQDYFVVQRHAAPPSLYFKIVVRTCRTW